MNEQELKAQADLQADLRSGLGALNENILHLHEDVEALGVFFINHFRVTALFMLVSLAALVAIVILLTMVLLRLP